MLKQRVITALILAGLFLSAIAYLPLPGLALAFGILVALAAWEWSALAGWHHALRLREARQRAEALLRLGQLGRLNAMGEFAAGLAHELNQPLTAVLSSTHLSQVFGLRLRLERHGDRWSARTG